MPTTPRWRRSPATRPRSWRSARWGSTSSAICPRPTSRCQHFAASSDWPGALGKPVVLHVRDAHEEALAILAEERVRDVGGVMHCFSADVAVARRCLDLGLFISLAGPVTYKNARALPDVARFVPGGPPRRGDGLPVPAARAAPRPAQ